MSGFKFLSNQRPVFRFELTTQVEWFPASLMGIDTWSGRTPQLVREWLSEYFFQNDDHTFNYEKYFPEIDRVCKIIQTGLDTTPFGERLLTAIVQIKRDDACFMEVHVQYPINQVIYY